MKNGFHNYTRTFQYWYRGFEDKNWSKIERFGVNFCNAKKWFSLKSEWNTQDRLFLCGVESDREIETILKDCSERPLDLVFLVRLNRENLYQFGTGQIDRANTLFILDFVPESIEERHHAFSLFHKSLLLRRFGPALYYYNEVSEVLSAAQAELKTIPNFADSFGIQSMVYRLRVFGGRIWQKYDLWYRYSKLRARLFSPRTDRKCLKDCRHAVITGWYGTETAGDKAILLELIHVLREYAPGIRISITSIVPGLSRLTNLETGLEAEIWELRDLDYRRMASVDLVVFGGGPLMDSSQLKYIETLFAWARRRGVATLVFGCGVGPLKTDAGEQRVKSILANTDQAFFRDCRSAEIAEELGFAGNLLHACDPAMRYVSRWRKEHLHPQSPVNGSVQMITLLRAQTTEYSVSAGAETDRLQAEVSGFIGEYLAADPKHTVQMLPMHTFWYGNDDRDYMRIVAHGVVGESKPERYEESPSLDMLLQRISSAAIGLPMRFHGHVFMLALNIPFVSINYTGTGGKVFNLIERYGLLDYSIALTDGIQRGEVIRKWRKLQEDCDLVKEKMRKQLAIDLARLEEIYDKLFGETQVAKA